MSRSIATNDHPSREELLDFLADRHHAIVITTRQSDGRPQASPVSAGIDPEGRVVVATYPDRAKANNARANPDVSVVFLSDDFEDAWVQVDGTAEVLDTVGPNASDEAIDGLVTYFRSIAGEHDDWDEYREAMVLQEKSLLRVTIERWSPIATGGFPPDVAAKLDARDAEGS